MWQFVGCEACRSPIGATSVGIGGGLVGVMGSVVIGGGGG